MKLHGESLVLLDYSMEECGNRARPPRLPPSAAGAAANGRWWMPEELSKRRQAYAKLIAVLSALGSATY
jgi:hypothetical protein